MTRPYPLHNPFPAQATFRFDAPDTQEEVAPGDDAPTIGSVAIDRLREVAEVYMRGGDRPARRGGQLAVLRGEHGSGKTHTIFRVRRLILLGEVATPPGVPMPVQLYAKADNPQFLELYQRLLKDLPFDTVRDTCLKYTGTVAGEQIGAEAGDLVRGRQASALLREQPGRLPDLYDNALVDRGAVQARQTQEVRRATGKASEDFERGVSHLSGPSTHLAQLAYEWLIGAPLAPDAIARIGVSGPIADAETGQAALSLFARLFRRAGQPLIIYIDQYENLVIDKNTELTRLNNGWLRSLVEDLPTQNGMLVLSGSEAAWDALLFDIKTRVPEQNLITLSAWSLKQGQQLIKLYLTPTDQHFDPASPVTEDELYPFTNAGVRRMLEFASGNARRFQQMASSMLEQALPDQTRIDADVVTAAVKRGDRLFFDQSTVLAEVHAALVQRGLRFRTEAEFEGVPVDFEVLFPDSSPRLLIRVSKALFSRDDIDLTRSHLNLIEKINEASSPARFVLVVVGYANPEILPRLQPLVHDLIVYRRGVFAPQFGAALDRMPTKPAAVATPEPLLQQLEALRGTVENLRQQREQDDAALKVRVTQLAKQQSVELDERRKAARLDWGREQEVFEDRIRQARAERRKAALDELERLRATSEQDRKRRVFVFAALVAVAGGGVALGSVAMRSDLPVDLFSLLLSVSLSLLGAAALYSLMETMGFGRGRAVRDLAAPASSIDELNRLARAYNLTPAGSGQSPAYHSNPHFRLAAALRWRGDAKMLLDAMRAERSGIVRHAMARSLASHEDFTSVQPATSLEQLARELPEEFAYMIEAAPDKLEGFVYGPNDFVLSIDRGLRRAFREYPVYEGLEEGYERGLDRVAPERLRELPERRVRDVIRGLSPFESGGLGTFDELRMLDEIDKVYLYLRRVLFYFERDLFAAPALEASPVPAEAGAAGVPSAPARAVQ